MKKLPGMETVLSDIQPDLARNLAGETGSAWVKHPDEIFADKSIQAVVICTPTQTHVPLIEMAVDTGKDVLCEKPLCETVEEVERLQKEHPVGHGVLSGLHPLFSHPPRHM